MTSSHSLTGQPANEDPFDPETPVPAEVPGVPIKEPPATDTPLPKVEARHTDMTPSRGANVGRTIGLKTGR